MDVQVVLTENDAKLGKRGDVVKVSSGFAQNFLIPHHKALLATPANLKNFEREKLEQSKKDALLKSQAEDTAKKINALSLTIEVLTGEAEKLYGAITSHEIHNQLAANGIAVERKDIHLEEPIKKLGAYQVPVKPHTGIQATLKLWVVKKKN